MVGFWTAIDRFIEVKGWLGVVWLWPDCGSNKWSGLLVYMSIFPG